MICFEIYINKQKVCRAGVGDDGVLSVIVNFKLSDESQRTYCSVGGITKINTKTSQQIEWLDRELSVGDVLTVKIVESEIYDMPANQQVNDLQCSFCEKKQAEVSNLIAGPNNYICNECVVSCSQVIIEGAKFGNIALFETEINCSLCGKQLSEVEVIVGFAENRICNECVDICKEIVKAEVSKIRHTEQFVELESETAI